MKSPRGLEQAGRSAHSESGLLGQPHFFIHGPYFTFRRSIMLLLFIAMGSVAVAILCLHSGAQPIGFTAMVGVVDRLLQGEAPSVAGDIEGTILIYVRLPRVLLAFFVGACLAVVGVALQALLRNPLADPYVLGVSSGSALGASLAVVFGMTHSLVAQLTLPMWAFLGGITATIVVYRIALAQGRLPVHTLLLAGIVMNAVLSALILFITSILDPNKFFRIMSWLMGNMSSPDFLTLSVLGCYGLVGFILLFRHARRLNIMILGEESALTLGVDVERTKKAVLVIAALLTGAAVSVSGMIGFVGMIIPHMLRMAIGADHRLLLPASGLAGGCFLMVSDTIARTAFAPAEIPVGVVTALLGGPVFIGLLTTRARSPLT
jgi:iron complex transport system permease protein